MKSPEAFDEAIMTALDGGRLTLPQLAKTLGKDARQIMRWLHVLSREKLVCCTTIDGSLVWSRPAAKPRSIRAPIAPPQRVKRKRPAERPHIKIRSGLWRCRSKKVLGRGPSPRAAYADWLRRMSLGGA